MVFYAKTNIRLAIDDVTKLPAVFVRGGIPLQQIVAAFWAGSGPFGVCSGIWKAAPLRQTF
jgi:hypothetical protein